MILRLHCPQCGTWSRTADMDAANGWPCPGCAATLPATSAPNPGVLDQCRSCGNPELYLQKDFPHWLGMGILGVAIGLSVITYSNYWIKTTWAILIGSAVIDALLYFLMGTVTVCYRCQAQHRGWPPNPGLRGFDLAVGEKYRQEKLRREQLERGGGNSAT